MVTDPLNLVYQDDGFQVFAGPYVAFGTWGSFRNDFSFGAAGGHYDSKDFFDKNVYTIKPVYGEVDDDKVEDLMYEEDLYDLYRAVDLGVTIGAGYQVNRILLSAGYSFGVVNLTPVYNAESYDMDKEYHENVNLRNRVFSFSVSYFVN